MHTQNKRGKESAHKEPGKTEHSHVKQQTRLETLFTFLTLEDVYFLKVAVQKLY